MRATADKQGESGVRRALKRLRSAAGMTLIELIVGLAISSVVSLMAAQFFSIAVRLHRSSTEISALQKEAQIALSQITRGIMGAEEIYFHDNGRESVLVLGRETNDHTGFAGQIFYYERQAGRLYADTDYEAKVTRQALFSSLRVQAEIGRIKAPEYLLSNKVEDFTLSLSKSLQDMKSLGNHAYAVSGSLSVTAALTMQYHESRSYEYTAKAVPREPVGEITWNDNR